MNHKNLRLRIESVTIDCVCASRSGNQEVCLFPRSLSFPSCRLLPVLMLGISLLALAPASRAETWTVALDGTGDFTDLQEAIDAAGSGDTIRVGPGIHEGPFWIETKSLVLRSIDGPAATILQGIPAPDRDSREPVVHFFYEEQGGSEISGFTIRDGESGIKCSSASPWIHDNVIVHNRGPIGSGVCCVFWSDAVIESNWIVGNRAIYNCCFPSRGGGIYADDSSPVVIRDNVVAFNQCRGQCLGGGISIHIGTVERNTVVGNDADGPAGGIELIGDELAVRANIVVGNRSHEFADGIMVQRDPVIECNDIWGNGSENYWGAGPGDGDFSEDPLLCGIPATEELSLEDPEAGVFALDAASPCLPGQHPDGADCGRIGARETGCGERRITAVPAPERAETALLV
ncbi:MAG: hypothetical protein GF346_01455, partial [Candidatus Eisenbacteria bacterium]|nr:hypothetical protein [Candidatus Latescibacterota bacterium]MBD3301096.1 hypothetical protein [Candidatus Eisenbacteria bacterium]